MSPRRALALTRQELLLLRQDPVPIVLTVGMPLVLLPFVEPVLRFTLKGTGFTSATGAEQAVPGLAVLFAFFLIPGIGDLFFREHSWNTWDRLRLTRLGRLDIIVGKAIPALVLVDVQMGALLVLGIALFDLHVRGSVLGLIFVTLSFGVAIVGMALMLVSLCRTPSQFDVIAALGALICSGLGGAMTPIHLLPVAVQRIAPLSPTYWAMRGFHAVLLQHGGVGSSVEPVILLWSIGAAALGVTAFRFRFDERKQTWT